MASFYKTFQTLRIVFMALFLCFFAVKDASAANELFTVENVTVDVSAENALKARGQAFEEAQLKAFTELSSRMLSEAELQSFQPPPLMTISTMIQDYEVSNEQLSSRRYMGTYKVRFQGAAVKRYFAKSGAQYTDIASKPILILPFLETDRGSVLWSHQNGWMKSWASALNLSSGLVPLIVPLGDLSDIGNIGDDEALTYNKRSLDKMVERYHAAEAVIAIARPEGTGLGIQLYRTDRQRPEYVHQILERALPGQAQDQLYTRAVQSVKAALRQDWKKKTVVEARQQGAIRVHVTFNSLQEWSDIQRSLGRVSGISDTALKALSPKEAYLELTYDGNIERLKLTLQQAGLYLGTPRYQAVNGGRGFNADYSQGLLGGSATRMAVYDLYSRKNAGAPQVPQTQTGTASPYQSRF